MLFRGIRSKYPVNVMHNVMSLVDHDLQLFPFGFCLKLTTCHIALDLFQILYKVFKPCIELLATKITDNGISLIIYLYFRSDCNTFQFFHELYSYSLAVKVLVSTAKVPWISSPHCLTLITLCT